jgi:hypothetical protein
MKRRIVISCLLLISFSFLMSEMNFGVGLDLPGTHELSGTGYSIDSDTAMGFQVFGEYLKPLSKSPGMNFDGGIGAAYLLPRNPDSDSDGDQAFSFIPLYVLGQVSTTGEGNVFFGKLRVGYDIFSGNDDYFPEADFSGGMFLGIGGGIIMTNNFFLELSYQMLKGSVGYGELEGVDIDVSDSHLSILVGLKIK